MFVPNFLEMVYTDYQNILTDIGRVWDLCKNRPNESREDLHTIQEQYMQSISFVQDRERNQIIEELLEVTNQLISSNNSSCFSPEQSPENDDSRLLSLSKRKALGIRLFNISIRFFIKGEK